MNFVGISARKKVAGMCAGTLLAGIGAATIAAPAATAAPEQCSASGVAGTVSSVMGSARQYLDNHPGANHAVTAAFDQPRPQAESNLRGYFTANPGEYYELRGILAPIGDVQSQCNVSVLPPELSSAYNTFMAG